MRQVGSGEPRYDIVMGWLIPGEPFIIPREWQEGFNSGVAGVNGLLRKWPKERWQRSQRLHAGARECEPKAHGEHSCKTAKRGVVAEAGGDSECVTRSPLGATRVCAPIKEKRLSQH